VRELRKNWIWILRRCEEERIGKKKIKIGEKLEKEWDLGFHDPHLSFFLSLLQF